MTRLLQFSLLSLLPCTLFVLAGCERKSDSPAPAAPATKPAATSAETRSPAPAASTEPKAAAPAPDHPTPKETASPSAEPVPQDASEPASAEAPARTSPPAQSADAPAAGPDSPEDVEWVAQGAWRTQLNASLDECGQLLEQLGATEAEHEALLNKFRTDVEQVLPLHREMSDNVARVKELAATGKSVTVGDKTYGPTEMQDLASRTQTTLATVNQWSDMLHQRTGDAAVMRSLVRSGRDTLGKLRNEITTVDKNLSFLDMLKDAPMPTREGEDGQKSVQTFRGELLREMGKKVTGLQQSAAQLKADISGGAVPPLDMKPVETQPTLDALNALHLETLALLEKAA